MRRARVRHFNADHMESVFLFSSCCTLSPPFFRRIVSNSLSFRLRSPLAHAPSLVRLVVAVVAQRTDKDRLCCVFPVYGRVAL